MSEKLLPLYGVVSTIQAVRNGLQQGVAFVKMQGKSFVEILGTETGNSCSVAYIKLIVVHGVISIQRDEWQQANVSWHDSNTA
jgi:hypothetical protein